MENKGQRFQTIHDSNKIGPGQYDTLDIKDRLSFN